MDDVILSVLKQIISFSRMIEKNRTYRIPRQDGGTDLFHVLEIKGDKLKLKNLKTDSVKTVSKSNFQKKLDAGEIYVSAETR